MYNPTNEEDANKIFEMLEQDSDIDLSDDEEEENYEPMSASCRYSARIDAEAEGTNNEMFIEDELLTVTDKSNIKWRRKHFETLRNMFAKPDENFVGPLRSPLEYFQKYLPDEFFEEVVNYTNIYGLQKSGKFKETNISEIKTLFGLHIIIGTLKFPRVRLYWDRVLGISIFTENMTRDRFFQLRSNLHIVNNLEVRADSNDRLFKIRPLYNYIRQRCLELEREENLSVDEQIVPFRGQLNIKQHIKGKPIPWGIKIFVLCGSSGQMYDFVIYQGSTTELREDWIKKYGSAATVIMHLAESIPNSCHKVYYDNYFSTYQLLQVLKQKNIFGAGTIRINRFSNPPLLSDKEMKKHGRGFTDQVVSLDEDVVVVKWMDNRSVTLASNFVGKGTTDEARRWDKIKKQYINVERPEIVKLYNQNMGGVDLLDQMVSLYRIYIRSKKWTLRMFFHGVDLAVVNSWFEYRKDCIKLNIAKKDQLDLLHFRMRLAEALVKANKTVSRKRPGRPSDKSFSEEPKEKTRRPNKEVKPIPEVQYDNVDHMPFLDDNKEGKRCKNNSCNQKTHFYCDKSNVHLCIKKEKRLFCGVSQKIII